MLGIPTQSDVKDRKYQQSLHIKELSSEIKGFFWPTSTTFIHNHVVNVIRHVDEDFDICLVKKLYQGKTDKKRKEVEALLSPELVLAYYLTRIKRFMAGLEKLRKYVDDPKNYFESSRAIDNEKQLSPLVEVEDCTMDWGVSESRPWWQFWKPKVNVMPARKYIYNPYEVAKAELTAYEQELNDVFNSSSVKIEQIERMWDVIEKYDKSANKQLVDHLDSMVTSSIKEPSYWEWSKPSSEAYRLYQENGRISKISDLYIRFDEVYWHIAGWGIPFEGMFEEPLLTQGKLWNRHHIRDLIVEAEYKHKAEGKGLFVVINGVRYGRSYKGSRFVGYKTEGDTYQEIVNLLAVPVEAGNGSFKPDKWAKQEVKLVGSYRNLPLEAFIQKNKKHLKSEKALIIPQPEIVRKILSVYKEFERDNGIDTEQEKADLVLYTLRKNDWKILHQTS